VPIEGPALDKKASIVSGKVHPTRETCNAYIVFAEAEGAQKALKLNGTQARGHHIRVDMAEGGNKQLNPRLSVFVGNLAFTAEEEAVRRYFGQCGKVASVRLIHDKATSLCKGFGYVLFNDTDGVQAAVKMHGTKFQGRPIRVFRASQRPPGSSKAKTQESDAKTPAAAAKGGPLAKKVDGKKEGEKQAGPKMVKPRQASGKKARWITNEDGTKTAPPKQVSSKVSSQGIPKFKVAKEGKGKKSLKKKERARKEAKFAKRSYRKEKKIKQQGTQR